ncbi:uncharacterized protein [Miscanthus floridulus]|uniref:uncharacterized protein n=1 Tax=Miscanthus floridulus TaxID=154761 RepID=UPI0034596B4A
MGWDYFGVLFPSLYTGTVVNSFLLLAESPSMPPKRANWSEDDTKLLLNLCLQEKDKFDFNQQGLTRTGWNNIYTNFPHYDKKQCNNKLGSLKKAYLTWKDELTATGLGRDPRTGDIEAEPEYWETQEDSMPEVRRGWQPRFLDQLEALFGDRNRNTGCFMSAGGICESTPPAALRPTDLGGPSSYHSSSKRDNMDNVVNNPEKKKTCNVGEYMAQLFERIAARRTSQDRKQTREQAEVDEAMQLLQEDGVPSTSDMFFLATMLFKDSVTRRVFKNLLKNPVRDMDISDEDSQNSSENSFNEMVTAAMARGYAYVYMLQVPLQGNHVISVPELIGRQWVDKLLSDAGAMDGTHVDLIVDQGVRDNHINRKGKTSQNVVAVYDFDMRFMYIGAGTVGSAHDMRGRYYLVDSGYALCPGYLTPYPNKRRLDLLLVILVPVIRLLY